MVAHYCDRACQKNHWKTHKLTCDPSNDAASDALLREFYRGAKSSTMKKQHRAAMKALKETGELKLPVAPVTFQPPSYAGHTSRAASQMVRARQRGHDQPQILSQLVLHRIASTDQWKAVAMCAELAAQEGDNNFGVVHILTKPGGILDGSGVEYWTAAIIFLVDTRTYHFCLSDHPIGIHKRLKGRYHGSDLNLIKCLSGSRRHGPGITPMVVKTPDLQYIVVDWWTGAVNGTRKL